MRAPSQASRARRRSGQAVLVFEEQILVCIGDDDNAAGRRLGADPRRQRPMTCPTLGPPSRHLPLEPEAVLVTVARPREPFWIVVVLAAVLTVAGCADQRPADNRPAGTATQARSSPPRTVALGPGADIRAENAPSGYPGWRVARSGRGSPIAGSADPARAPPGP